MSSKLAGNRTCGRLFCPGAQAFSAGIKCWHCMYPGLGAVLIKLLLSFHENKNLLGSFLVR